MKKPTIFEKMRKFVLQTENTSISHFLDALQENQFRPNEIVIGLAFRYLHDNLEFCKEKNELSKKELLEKCVDFSSDHLARFGSPKAIAITSFGKVVKTLFPGVEGKRVTVQNKQTYCFVNLKFKSEGYLPEYSSLEENLSLPAYSKSDPLECGVLPPSDIPPDYSTAVELDAIFGNEIAI